MKRILLAMLPLLAHGFPAGAVETVSFGSGQTQFSIDFVTVGNPGNMDLTFANPSIPPLGGVDYFFGMGKHEVSRDMVIKASQAGNLGISQPDMVLQAPCPAGMDCSMSQLVTAGPKTPASAITFLEAARFVNWLNTSEGFAPAYKFEKQPGDVGYSPADKLLAWSPADPGYDPMKPFRNSRAAYVLPSKDEFVKAAYYDPAKGATGGYWAWPTGSDQKPAAVASGMAPETAVHSQFSDTRFFADIDLAGGLSPYGTMGQAGNGSEWVEETNLSASTTAFCGGTYVGISIANRLCGSNLTNADAKLVDMGFRVAKVPEPSTGLSALLGMFALATRRRRAQ